jgi:hypothetical protein
MQRLLSAAALAALPLCLPLAAQGEVLAEIPIWLSGGGSTAVEGVEVVVRHTEEDLGDGPAVFEGIVWRPEDVGKTVALSTPDDPEFHAVADAFADGVNGYVDVFGATHPGGAGPGFATSESNFFFGDPTGQGRVDFEGFVVDLLALRLDALALGTPSATGYTLSMTLIVSGHSLACSDPDADGFGDPGEPGCRADNCPTEWNPGQEDADRDGLGDLCDSHPLAPSGDLEQRFEQCTEELFACQVELVLSEDARSQCAAELEAASAESAACRDELDAAREETARLAGDLAAARRDLESCEARLAGALSELAAALADSDADGVRDAGDACPGSAAGSEVDAVGCSLAQFCAAIDASTGTGRSTCNHSDWRNDEPLSDSPNDCKAQAGLCLAR